VFRISGATGQGTQELCEAVMQHLASAGEDAAAQGD
jgi:predicted GTPase